MAITQTVTVGDTTATVLIRGSLEHVADFDALTPAGAGVSAKTGAYVSGSKRLHTPRWEALYSALRERDAAAIVSAARRLRSIRVSLDTRFVANPNHGLRVSMGTWCLFCAAVVG